MANQGFPDFSDVLKDRNHPAMHTSESEAGPRRVPRARVIRYVSLRRRSAGLRLRLRFGGRGSYTAGLLPARALRLAFEGSTSPATGGGRYVPAI